MALSCPLVGSLPLPLTVHRSVHLVASWPGPIIMPHSPDREKWLRGISQPWTGDNQTNCWSEPWNPLLSLLTVGPNAMCEMSVELRSRGPLQPLVLGGPSLLPSLPSLVLPGPGPCVYGSVSVLRPPIGQKVTLPLNPINGKPARALSFLFLSAPSLSFKTFPSFVCCPLALEAISFIHSFFPTEQSSRSFSTRKYSLTRTHTYNYCPFCPKLGFPRDSQSWLDPKRQDIAQRHIPAIPAFLSASHLHSSPEEEISRLPTAQTNHTIHHEVNDSFSHHHRLGLDGHRSTPWPRPSTPSSCCAPARSTSPEAGPCH